MKRFVNLISICRFFFFSVFSLALRKQREKINRWRHTHTIFSHLCVAEKIVEKKLEKDEIQCWGCHSVCVNIGLWLKSVQTEECEQSKNRFDGVVAVRKNAHSNHELTMNEASEREWVNERSDSFFPVSHHQMRMCTMVNIASEFFWMAFTWLFFFVFFVVSIPPPKESYLPNAFRFSWCRLAKWNLSTHMTRSPLPLQCYCCCYCGRMCLCVCALVCGNKIELQHILNINTNSVHCVLRRLTLLSDKSTIKHVCLRLHDELLPLAYSKEKHIAPSLSTAKRFFFLPFSIVATTKRSLFPVLFLFERSSSGRIFVICQNLSVEQRGMERTMCFFTWKICDGRAKKIFGADAGKCRINLMVCNWCLFRVENIL